MKPETLLPYLGQLTEYSPKLAKVMGGVAVAVFVCFLLQRQFENGEGREWVRVTRKEIEYHTGLSVYEQERAKKQLEMRSLLQQRLVNRDREVIEFWLDLPALIDLLENFDKPKDDFAPIPSSYSTISSISQGDPYYPFERKPISVAVSPHYSFSGPWESTEEFEEFQRALLDYFKQEGSPNPAAYAFRVIDGISKGILSPLWEDFVNGVPLGESQKVQRDWEVSPGVAYPAFEEERVSYYVHKGEPIESAVSKARRELRNPLLAKDLWEGFLRKCDRVADEAIAAKKQGIQTPYLPPSFSDKPQITKESVIEKLASLTPTSIASSDSFPSQNSAKNLPHGKTSPADTTKSAPQTREIPSLKSLQKAYSSPFGKKLIEQQIANHPEWGYAIQEGQVVELYPF